MDALRFRFYLGLMALDAIALFAANSVANFVFRNPAGEAQYLNRFAICLTIYLGFAVHNRLYNYLHIESLGARSWSAIRILLSTELIIILMNYLAKSSAYSSRGHALLMLVYGSAFLMGVRILADAVLRRRGLLPLANVLYVRDGAELPEIRHRHFSIDMERSAALLHSNDPEAMHVIGGSLMNMDRVVVACPPDRRPFWSLIMRSLNIQGEFIDDQAYRLGAAGIYKARSYSSLIVSLPPLAMQQRMMKRAFDLAFAMAALVPLAPVLAMTALLIKLEDGGPVLFVQQRTGRNNRFFRMYKFRSMKVDRLDAAGTRPTGINDDRLTRIGRVIRRTSIDELPQLFNVLLGDMSLVGPRPHAVGSRAGGQLFWEVDQRYWQRHALKPGLTGLAQVRGLRGATDTEEDLLLRLQCDLDYVRNWSLWGDIAIIAATVRVVVHQKAY